MQALRGVPGRRSAEEKQGAVVLQHDVFGDRFSLRRPVHPAVGMDQSPLWPGDQDCHHRHYPADQLVSGQGVRFFGALFEGILRPFAKSVLIWRHSGNYKNVISRLPEYAEI